MSSLSDRLHYALPLNHVDFANIRMNVCICNGEELNPDNYRYSQDGLLIQVKCYPGQEITSMNDLVLVDENDTNWINPGFEL